MCVSFDVDETLICRRTVVPVEMGPLPSVVYKWFCEPLRRGTRSLVNKLRQQGCSIWIYTTSGRTTFQIQLWLWLHGIRVDGVVNEERHRKQISSLNLSHPPSKYPPAFGINLHIDDSEGVQLEGVEHGFQVCVIRPEDEDWTQKILDAVSHFRASQP